MPGQPYILLVEDNPGDAGLVQDMVEHGLPGALTELRWEQSAAAAAARLRREPGCSAVLLDLGLPDSHGLEALALVRQHADEVPIIVLSGNDDEEVGLSAVVAGAQDYLVKGSFDGALLRRSLRYALHRKRMEQELVRRAMHDPLTGLPTRTLLLDRLQMALAIAARDGSSGALLFVDLNRFKQVNDRYGHAAGDAVLKAVAARMCECTRESDTVARVGGDEFLILLPVVNKAEGSQVAARKILAALTEPVPFVGELLVPGAAIGVVDFGAADRDAEDLIARADAAMYDAKREGHDTVR